MAKLETMKKREESYSQMKDRVTKLKSLINKKIDDYYLKRNLKMDVQSDDIKEPHDDNFEDKDLILDEHENIEKEDSEEEAENSEKDDVDDITKVLTR